MATPIIKFEPVLQLNIRATIRIADHLEGEELYRQLKEMLKSYTPDVQVFGIISEQLEPCCGKKKGDPNAQSNSQGP